jgi:hypothetical protein
MRNGGSVDGRGIINGGPVGVEFVSVDVGVDSADAGYWRLRVCSRISSSLVRRIVRSAGLLGLWYWPT